MSGLKDTQGQKRIVRGGFEREKPERTITLGRPRSRCSDNSKTVLTDIMGRRELNSSGSE